MLKGYMLICWNAEGGHAHLSECWRGTWSEKGWEPLFYWYEISRQDITDMGTFSGFILIMCNKLSKVMVTIVHTSSLVAISVIAVAPQLNLQSCATFTISHHIKWDIFSFSFTLCVVQTSRKSLQKKRYPAQPHKTGENILQVKFKRHCWWLE